MRASSSQRGYGPWRALDNDPNTEWASGGYQSTRAALQIEFRRPHRFGRILLKTGPTNGADYVITASQDGEVWYPAVSARLTFDDWNIHEFASDANGRYLRVEWFNWEGTADHASVYYLRVFERARDYTDVHGRGVRHPETGGGVPG